MLIAGLTGGLACGKSFVAAALQELGCFVVEADELGHQALQPGGAAYAPVIAEFGTTDRKRLAEIVFADPAQLARLNAIVHPAVHALAHQKFLEIGTQDPQAIIIYAAAILIETGVHREFPRLIVVACSGEQQFARAMRRPGATEADVRARLARQLPLQQKRELADFLIDSSGTPADTLRQTKIVFEELRKLPQ